MKEYKHIRLLVIQEQHFTLLPNGEVWVDKQSGQEFWERYLSVFEEIIVCARMKNADTIGVKALRSDRAKVKFMGMPDFRGAGGIVKNYRLIQKVLNEAIEQCDCVIFRAPSPISMVSYRAVVKSKKPFAVELMNNPWTHFSKRSMRHIYQPIIQMFVTNQTKRMCKTANGVAYVTEHVLQELYPSKARLNGEDSLFFESSYSTIHLDKKDFVMEQWPNIRPNTIVLIHSGEMLDYRKGQDIFIECIYELRRMNIDVYGILIGDGELRSEFEDLAKKLGIGERMSFVGWKSGFKKVQSELKKGHFFVFPSTGEGLPRSIIEAMATGLVCFGSSIDGVKELLDKELLVDDYSGKSFANCILPFILNWDRTLEKRKELFSKSKKYEATLLQARRTIFYSKLRKICYDRKK